MAKYSKVAGKKVEKSMHAMHEGKLKCGKSGEKVTSHMQAIKCFYLYIICLHNYLL